MALLRTSHRVCNKGVHASDYPTTWTIIEVKADEKCYLTFEYRSLTIRLQKMKAFWRPTSVRLSRPFHGIFDLEPENAAKMREGGTVLHGKSREKLKRFAIKVNKRIKQRYLLQMTRGCVRIRGLLSSLSTLKPPPPSMMIHGMRRLPTA